MRSNMKSRGVSILAVIAIASSAWSFLQYEPVELCKPAGRSLSVLCNQGSTCTGSGACSYCDGVLTGQQKLCVNDPLGGECPITVGETYSCGNSYTGTCTLGVCGNGSAGGPCASVSDECS